MKVWWEFAKAQKETWVRISKGHGDMPPFVIAERGGEPLLIVVSPKVDKRYALSAAHLLRVGLNCDSLCVVTDGYGVFSETPEQYEATYNEICEKYGCLQKGFESGHPGICETINAMRYHPDGKMSMVGADYKVEGKKVVWGEQRELDEEEVFPPDFDPDEAPKRQVTHVGGNIARAIRSIMREPCFLEQEKVKAVAKMCGVQTDERALYHSGRAIRKLLHQRDYLILECVPWKPEEGYGELLKRMMKLSEDLKDVYDIDNMKTSPQFLQQYELN